MALLANDTYPDSDGTDLRVHVLQGIGISAPGGFDAYDYPDPSNDLEIYFASIRAQDGAAPRVRVWLDLSIDSGTSGHIVWGDFYRGGVDNVSQACGIAIGADSVNGLYPDDGMWIEASRRDAATMNLNISIRQDAGTVRDVLIGFIPWLTDAGKRLEVERVGNAVNAYSSDLNTGLNRVLEGSTNLTVFEQQTFDGGSHRNVSVFVAANPTSAAMFMSEFELNTIDSITPLGSTLLTIASGVPVINIVAGFQPIGDTLGTLASDVPIFQINVTPIGSTFQPLLSGVPTFTGLADKPATLLPDIIPVADIEPLASPPQKYNQLDESQTRRVLERNIQKAFSKLDDLVSANVMTWGGEWVAGLTYPKNTVVISDGWLMIANKDTTDPAAPQLVGPPEQGIPSDPAWTFPSDTGIVATGQDYTFSETGLITHVRVWIPDIVDTDLEYGITVVNVDTQEVLLSQSSIDISSLSAPGWLQFATSEALIVAGTTLAVSVICESHLDDAVTQWNYVYDGNVATPPPSGDWNREGDGIVRLNIIDDDSNDNSVALGLLAPGTELLFTEALQPNRTRTYSIVSNQGLNGQGTAYEFVVQLLGASSLIRPGELCTVDVTAYGVAPVPYVSLAAYWNGGTFPSWASDVQGIIQDAPGLPAIQSDTVYGADFTFQNVEASPDWDMMAYTDLGAISSSQAQTNEAATGMVQASGGAATVAIAVIDTDVPYATAAVEEEVSNDWTVNSSDALEFFSAGDRLITIFLDMVWDTAPANQIFVLSLLLDGVSVESRTVPMGTNKPQMVTMTLQTLVNLGTHTLQLVVRNTTSIADLDVEEIHISIIDTPAQQSL